MQGAELVYALGMQNKLVVGWKKSNQRFNWQWLIGNDNSFLPLTLSPLMGETVWFWFNLINLFVYHFKNQQS